MEPAGKSRIGIVPDIFGLLLQVLFVAASGYWVITSYLEEMPMTSIVGYWFLLICAVLSLLHIIIQRHRKNNLPVRTIENNDFE